MVEIVSSTVFTISYRMSRGMRHSRLELMPVRLTIARTDEKVCRREYICGIVDVL